MLQNRQRLSMGKELGRVAGGAVFQGSISEPAENVAFQWHRPRQFITSFLSLGFSLGYEPRELKKITKWLHLDEPHSN